MVKLYSLLSEEVINQKRNGIDDYEDYRHSLRLRRKIGNMLSVNAPKLFKEAEKAYRRFGI